MASIKSFLPINHRLPPRWLRNPRARPEPPDHRAALGLPLQQSLQLVEQSLRKEAKAGDIKAARYQLDLLAAKIREDSCVLSQEYGFFLQDLTQSYRAVCRDPDHARCLETAANFANLVEATSHKYSAIAYEDILGLLLDLMTRLFQARDNSWSTLYHHLRAIPDYLEAKQHLKRVCSADIREWFDAGVQNLFSLQKNLAQKSQAFAAEAEQIQVRIRSRKHAAALIQRYTRLRYGDPVVSLRANQVLQRVRTLEEERDGLLEQRDSTREIRTLIESDIREFERLLNEARHAYYLRLVR